MPYFAALNGRFLATQSLTLALLLALSGSVAAQEVPEPKRQAQPEGTTAEAEAQRLLRGPDLKGKDGPMAKVGSQLRELYVRFGRSTSEPERQKALSKTAASTSEDRVAVDAVATQSASQLQADLKDLGLIRSATAGRLVSGLIPVEALSEAAKLPSLREIKASITRTNVGRVTSGGDPAMKSDVARSDENVDGTGTKVGVISDSYNQAPLQFGPEGNLANATQDIESGDLPPRSEIQVLQDDPFPLQLIDEGRGMMQIVRDVAPGASQAFHQGSLGIATMVEAIRDLAAAGSDVIVDDLGFFNSPFFQDGPIATVADSVASEGIPYFTSAGNQAQQSYASEFREVETESSPTFHDFDRGTETDIYQAVSIPPGTSVTIVFQWTDPVDLFGIGNTPDSDLDVFLVDDTLGVQASSVGANLALPNEIVRFENDGSIDADGDGQADETFFLAFELFDGPAPDQIKYITFQDPSSREPIATEHVTSSPTAFGQSNAAGVASVGAVRFSETPAFGVSPPDVRDFSSEGGIPIYFNKTGERLSSPVVREKPDITAPDGADNTFFGRDTDGDGFPNFRGTSAAAPHAAAVAALMLEKNPGLAPTEIYSALEESAVDMDDPATAGFETGFDFRTGHGLIQADAALASVEAQEPLLSLSGTVKYPAVEGGQLTEGRAFGRAEVEAASSDTVATAPAGEDGTFQIPGLPSGEYSLEAAVTGAPQNVSTGDAQRVILGAIGAMPFAGDFQRRVADVNGDGEINATDALQIARFDLGLVDTFEAGASVSESDTVSAGGETGVDLRVAERGDVRLDGGEPGGEAAALSSRTVSSGGTGAAFPGGAGVDASVAPSKRSDTGSYTVSVSPGETFEVPVRVGGATEIGAYRLAIKYPSDVAAFEGAEAAGEDVLTATSTGTSSEKDSDERTLNIAWFARDEGSSISLGGETTLATLRFKAIEDVKRAEFAPAVVEGEITGPEAEPLSATVEVQAVSVGKPAPDEFSVERNYPNPTTGGETTIEMDLPSRASVSVEIYNALGQKVKTKEETVAAGPSQRLRVDTDRLPSGQYFYRVEASLQGETAEETGQITVLE